MRRSAPVLAALALALVPAAAHASSTPSGGAGIPVTGGAAYGDAPSPSSPAFKPRLRAFALSSRILSAKVRYRFAASRRVRDVRITLLRARDSKAVRTYRRGSLSPRRAYSLIVASKGLAPGNYRVRITARRLLIGGVPATLTVRVPKPKVVREPKPAPAPVQTPTSTTAPNAGDHVFPVRGPFSFGGAGSRFGAKRSGHTHQGQDVAAAEGTPVVAPHDATVKASRYQAGGAGYYLVLASTGEDRDYVFMHLKAGSILVKEGRSVRMGDQIAQVGNTGSSEGAHLHFELWRGGGWYTGGKPVDPLPYLKAWAGL